MAPCAASQRIKQEILVSTSRPTITPCHTVLDQSADWGPLPSWQACRTAARPSLTEDTSDSNDKKTTDNEDNQPLGCHHTPKHRNNPMPQRSSTNQNNGSTILPSAPWLVKACPACSRSLDLALAHPIQKSTFTTGSSHASTIQTRTIPPPLDSRQRKHQSSSNCSTTQMTT